MAVIKHHGQSQPGRKTFYFILQLSGHTPSSLPESGQKLKARTWEQKLQQKPGSCSLACFKCCLPSYTITPTALPTSQSCVGIFSSQVCPGLCQADIKVSQRTIRVCVVCHRESTFSLAWVRGYDSTTEGLPSVCKALGFISSIAHLSYKK